MRTLSQLLFVFLIACATTGSTSSLPREILGVYPGMHADTAREHLQKTGSLQRKERKRQEVWSVRDERFDGIIIGLDSEERVRFITAVVRPEAGLRYAAIADLAQAEHESAGQSHTYRWRGSRDGTVFYVIAIGGPEHVQYYSLKASPFETE